MSRVPSRWSALMLALSLFAGMIGTTPPRARRARATPGSSKSPSRTPARNQALVDARVFLIGPTVASALTTKSGIVKYTDVPSGIYRVRVSKSGFTGGDVGSVRGAGQQAGRGRRRPRHAEAGDRADDDYQHHHGHRRLEDHRLGARAGDGDHDRHRREQRRAPDLRFADRRPLDDRRRRRDAGLQRSERTADDLAARSRRVADRDDARRHPARRARRGGQPALRSTPTSSRAPA